MCLALLLWRNRIKMDKKPDRKSHIIHGDKHERIGTPLNIHDMNGEPLFVGDIVDYVPSGFEECIILWNAETRHYELMLTRSNWYDNHEKYNSNSYGKSYGLRLDESMRMDLKLVEHSKYVV